MDILEWAYIYTYIIWMEIIAEEKKKEAKEKEIRDTKRKW